MKQGEIVMLAFPYSNLTDTKRRPAVVLSTEEYNKYGNALLAGIYGKKQPLSLQISNRDLVRKQLQKTSFISIQNLMSVEKTLITHTIDALSERKLAEVISVLTKHL